MLSSEIYTNFSKEINWIREKIQEETLTFPNSLKSLVEYYVRKRLIILSDKTRPIIFDPELGRPVPYATFWFAEAFGFTKKKVTRRLALGLVYSSLATTIRDDILDHDPSKKGHFFTLANIYLHRYLAIFNYLFDRNSKFWYYLASCIKELERYENWNRISNYDNNFDPFSESFLKESSRYFSAVVMPTIAALAIATGNEGKISIVNRFLKHFSMGWRIFDDLNDWRKDLKVKNLNHSSTLLYTLQNIGGKNNLNEEVVLSMFLSTDFVKKAYGAMLSFFRTARKDVSAFDCSYLTKFMDEQISFQIRKRDSLLRLNSDFYMQLNKILSR